MTHAAHMHCFCYLFVFFLLQAHNPKQMVSHAREAIVTELIQAFLAHPFERRENVAKAVLSATEQRGLDESDLDLDKVQAQW